MNRKSLFLILVASLFIGNIHNTEISGSETKPMAIRICKGFGFFAEYFWALNHIAWCVKTNQIPIILWDERFPYFQPEGYNESLNGWGYYFKISNEATIPEKRKEYKLRFYENDFSVLWHYHQYIVNLDLLPSEERARCINISHFDYEHPNTTINYPVGSYHLYDPEFRSYIKNEIITPYAKINKFVQRKIDAFYNKYRQGKKTICIHLRGKFIENEVAYIPPEIIFEKANEIATKDCQFYIATDQYPLLELAKKQLNGKVVYYNCYRTETTTSPVPGDQLGAKMGEDVLVETALLSRGDHLVHTISNVSTAALYFSPELEHTLLY